MKKLSRITLKKEVMITDTGSTKGKTMKQADHLWPQRIGLLAGILWQVRTKWASKTQGLTFLKMPAMSSLPSQRFHLEKIDELICWLSGTNAHFLTLDPEGH